MCRETGEAGGLGAASAGGGQRTPPRRSQRTRDSQGRQPAECFESGSALFCLFLDPDPCWECDPDPDTGPWKTAKIFK
jgi:hypothetical protein